MNDSKTCDACGKDVPAADNGWTWVPARDPEYGYYVCEACCPRVLEAVVGMDRESVMQLMEAERRRSSSKKCDSCFNHICIDSDIGINMLAPPESYTDECKGCPNEDNLKLSIAEYVQFKQENPSRGDAK